MSKDTKLYDLLNVEPTSTLEEIRAAYKKAARECHPDRNPSPENANKFKDISAAHAILVDPEKRATYDKVGIEGLKDGSHGSGHEDLFSHLFQRFGFGEQSGHDQPELMKVQPIVRQIDLKLEDCFNSKTIKVEINRMVTCKSCSGSGCKPGVEVSKCHSCKGEGYVSNIQRMGPIIQSMKRACEECEGEGTLTSQEDKCTTCSGEKVASETVTLESFIKKGVEEGQKITLPNEGHRVPDAGPGDVLLVVCVQADETFSRHKNDLFMVKEISMVEALCGFRQGLPIRHLDGRILMLKNPPGKVIQPGMKKQIDGEGMPMYDNPLLRGDLIVEFLVKFPEKILDITVTEKIEELFPRGAPIPAPEDSEEVALHDYHSPEVRGSDEYDDGERGGVQCQQQ